jgi:uncharacterized membrane protein YtjA (UPF0391 family)
LSFVFDCANKKTDCVKSGCFLVRNLNKKLRAYSSIYKLKTNPMLRWTVIFIILAIIAGIFGFGGIAAGAASIAKVLFFIFLVLFVISLISGRTKV